MNDTENGTVGVQAGTVTITVGGSTFGLDPEVARELARALRKAAETADDYARRKRAAAATAMPMRANGAGILRVVSKVDA